MNHVDLTRSELFLSTGPAQSLKKMPLGFVDVGARGGAHPFVDPLKGLTSVLGFEPDDSECDRIKGHRSAQAFGEFEMLPVALGKTSGPETLYLQAVDTNHSLLHPNEGFIHRYDMVKWKNVASIPLTTTTMDEQLFGVLADKPNQGEFIKLDTQGSEYEILEGATRTLSERTVAIITEVSFCELYNGQKLFPDIELFLREKGFSFYGFGQTYTRSRGIMDKKTETTRERLIQADAFFFKDPIIGGEGKRFEVTERQLHMTFITALLCGYFDYAYELAVRGWADGAEARRIRELISIMSAAPTQKTVDEVTKFCNQVVRRPDLSNLLVGRFVDDRRQSNDVAERRSYLTEQGLD